MAEERLQTTRPRERMQTGSGSRLGALLRAHWLLSSIVVMALIGLGISIYLTVVHYTKVPLACTDTSLINCQNVVTSSYSVVPFTNIPITIPGMLWFLVSGGVAVASLRAFAMGAGESARLRQAQLLWGLAGLLYVLYLVYAEIVLVHNICEWCTGVHILTLLTFLAAFYRFQHDGDPQPAPQQSKAVSSHGQSSERAVRAPQRQQAMTHRARRSSATQSQRTRR